LEARRAVDHKPTDYESHFTVSDERFVDYRLHIEGSWWLNVCGSWEALVGAVVCLACGFVVGVILAQRPREAAQSDVKRAANRYRDAYGDRALEVIGDHTLAARFAPTHEHYRFLLQVTQELQRRTWGFP
jgi:hypothetical protein